MLPAQACLRVKVTTLAFDLPPSAQPTLYYQVSDSLLSYPEVYAVVDLYGQCVQVSITNATGPMDNSLATSNTATEKSFPLHSPGSAGWEGGQALSVCCRPEVYSFQVREAIQRQAGCSNYRQRGRNDPWGKVAKKRAGGYTWYTRPGHFPATQGPGHHKLRVPGSGISLTVVKRGIRDLEGVMADGTFMSTLFHLKALLYILYEAHCPSLTPFSGAIFPQWLVWLTDSTVLVARMSLWRRMARGQCVQLAMLMALSSAPRSSGLRKSLRWAVEM